MVMLFFALAESPPQLRFRPLTPWHGGPPISRPTWPGRGCLPMTSSGRRATSARHSGLATQSPSSPAWIMLPCEWACCVVCALAGGAMLLPGLTPSRFPACTPPQYAPEAAHCRQRTPQSPLGGAS